ncbi:MAG: SMP-30/gluconolactonase/LRE family protein [Polyangiaceae bacterium]
MPHKLMTQLTVDVAFATPSELGEGALWDEREQLLYWVDILLNKVYAYRPSNRSNVAYDVGENVGTVVPGENNLLWLGLRSGFGWLDVTTGRVGHIVDPESHKPHTRFNDGKCDPRGRFWAGTICEGHPQFDGGLYCLDTDLTVIQKLENVQCSNGLAWSKDERSLYYIDTATQEVWAFRFEPDTGAIGEKRVVFSLPKEQGSPDGMTIDSEDFLWIALWNGGRVIRVDPRTGQVVFELSIPARNVTSVAFGGRDLDELYITTARVGTPHEVLRELPKAGSLFVAKVPFRGVPARRFPGLPTL